MVWKIQNSHIRSMGHEALHDLGLAIKSSQICDSLSWPTKSFFVQLSGQPRKILQTFGFWNMN
jgi:hypothetical protein